jgi:REP-associated tyrosine transposase
MVTASTYRKELHFHDAERLTYLTQSLLRLASRYAWSLHAWAVFPNHYHFVAFSETPETLQALMRHLHSDTARHVNGSDRTPARQVWFQYWDSHISKQRAYLARLNYVHTNPVRHGLVPRADNYPWCSAGWFARRASLGYRKTVMRFPSDLVSVPDDFSLATWSWRMQEEKASGGEPPQSK